jgi:hypothetical protein
MGSSDLIIFQYPRTGLNVQTMLNLTVKQDEHGTEQRNYETVNCPACAQLHFVNRMTGKLLGHENK